LEFRKLAIAINNYEEPNNYDQKFHWAHFSSIKYLMNLRFIKLIFFSFVLNLASLSVFAASPPNDFMALEVCLKYSDSSCSLKEFVDLGFSPDARRSWEKTDTNQWTLTLNFVDKISKKKGKVITAFNKEDANGKSFAVITRMISNDGQAVLARNGQVYATADEEISPAMLPSVVVPMIQTVNEKTGRAAQARANNKVKVAAQKRLELKKDFEAIPGKYFSDSEQIEIVKVSDDTVKAKISVKCSPISDDPLKVYEQVLKLKYSSDEGRYTSSLSVDKCNLSVMFGYGQMDTIQGVEFIDADNTSKPRQRGEKANGCCIRGRFLKRTKAEVDANATAQAEKQTQDNLQKTESDSKIAALVGHYENSQADVGGAIDVALDGNSALRVTYAKKECSFQDKKASVEYLEYNETSVGKFKEGDCEISLKFSRVKSMNKNVLSIDESGNCKNLCPQAPSGFSIIGNFDKK